jgi:hypothetical protein
MKRYNQLLHRTGRIAATNRQLKEVNKRGRVKATYTIVLCELNSLIWCYAARMTGKGSYKETI